MPLWGVFFPTNYYTLKGITHNFIHTHTHTHKRFHTWDVDPNHANWATHTIKSRYIGSIPTPLKQKLKIKERKNSDRRLLIKKKKKKILTRGCFVEF